MRTATAGELITLAGVTRQVTFWVNVENGSGTMKELTTWVESVEMNLDIDQPVSGCTVNFRRDSGATLSLSPLRTDSTLNRLDDTVTYSPQLDIGRDIQVYVATTPVGAMIQPEDYKLLFWGMIDLVNFEQSPVSVTCRDKGALLVDRWIEVERDYGTVPGVALEGVMQNILDDNLGVGVVNLSIPVSPLYQISPAYSQQKMPIMDALTALAQLPGFDVRYKWSDLASNFLLTLSEPARTKTIPDHTFGPSAYFGVRNLELDLANVRNVVTVSFPFNSSTMVENTDSITKYGRRFFFIQEDEDSPINTAGEAEIMADAILLDLKDPKAEQEVELPFFWPAELGDLYRFSANAVHYNVDTDLAVVSVRHEIARGHHRTILTLRGKPAGGYLTWLDRPLPPTPAGPVAPTIPLLVRARITATTALTATVRVAVANSLPSGLAIIAYTETGMGAATSPTSPQSVTPEATLTEAAGTYIDFTCTRPAVFQGTGRITFTVTSDARISGTDAVDIPAVDQNDTAQGTVAIDSNGAWDAIVDGPDNALSFRWSSSTSAFPVDATVASSGTLVTGTGRLLSMTGSGLTLGQNVYITVVPFSAVSGGGTQLPSLHIQGSYQSTSGSRTTRYAATAFFHPTAGNAQQYNRLNFAYAPQGKTTADGTGTPDEHFANVPVALGMTLTAFRLRTHTGNPFDQVALMVYRQDADGSSTQLGTTQTSTGAGYATLTVGSLSEAASAGRSYLYRCKTMKDTAAGLDTTRMSWFEVDEDYPDLKTNL